MKVERSYVNRSLINKTNYIGGLRGINKDVGHMQVGMPEMRRRDNIIVGKETRDQSLIKL